MQPKSAIVVSGKRREESFRAVALSVHRRATFAKDGVGWDARRKIVGVLSGDDLPQFIQNRLFDDGRRARTSDTREVRFQITPKSKITSAFYMHDGALLFSFHLGIDLEQKFVSAARAIKQDVQLKLGPLPTVPLMVDVVIEDAIGPAPRRGS